jgi:23S rRNA (guanosine2251-2'-O)-methyltransferase
MSHKKRGNSKQNKQVEQDRQGELPDNLLWGINPILEGLKSRSLSEVCVQQGKGGSRIQEIVDLARSQGVKLRFAPSNRLGIPDSRRHQGVVGRRAETGFFSLEELLTDLAGSERGGFRLLVLDSIQDPQNLGSILRTALAAGFGHVIITRERSTPISGTVARTSAGALAHLKICQVVNLAVSLKELKKQGFWIYGAVVSSGAESLYKNDYSGNIALVVGSEGKGIRSLVMKSCDHLITIPMEADFDSLNVSVAAGIIMFEINRCRNLGEV